MIRLDSEQLRCRYTNSDSTISSRARSRVALPGTYQNTLAGCRELDLAVAFVSCFVYRVVAQQILRPQLCGNFGKSVRQRSQSVSAQQLSSRLVCQSIKITVGRRIR